MSARPFLRGNLVTSTNLEAYHHRILEEDEAKENNDSNGDDSDDSDDDINYDSDDDDKLAKKHANQRRQQEAHIAGYRQQMMKTTNGPPPSIQHARLPTVQAPRMKIPRHGDDDDEDVPLAMLQAQRQKDSMSRLGGVRSNPTLRATAQQQISRPGSAQSQSRNKRANLQLPSFARALPQDPFQDPFQNPFQDPIPLGQNGPFQQPFSGGLVGVIASEERAKASRRGGPSGNFQQIPSPTNSTFGRTNGSYQTSQMPHGFPRIQQSFRPQTAATSGSQAPLWQMSHNLQAQPQFLQAAPWMSQHKTSQSWNHFTSQMPVQKHAMAPQGTGWAVPAYGAYAPSIAPSERSTIGLPSRYRAVSRAHN
ncbi:hypothetical protein BKA56DRAFT_604432 [Ilyonectria sp. MPI-CAGE-AT-0026]|nr:hypothetical protein BKA56DRAFT_604432 [Ilyonectria sp. MPI-CAGE-AT-0026]